MLSSTRRTAGNQGAIRLSMYATSGTKNQSVMSKKVDSESKRSLKVPVRLVDANGTDYTPLPLLSDDKKLKDIEKDTPTDNISQVSFYTQSISSFLGTNPVGFVRSKSQQSSSGFTAESSSSMSDELNEGTVQSVNFYTEVKAVKPDGTPDLKEDELDKEIEILLKETDNIWIFDMAPTVFGPDSEDSAEIENKNKQYEILLNSRAGNDKYVERGMTTFTNAHISKHIQTNRIGHNDVFSMATLWDIHDTHLTEAEKERNLENMKDENIEINASPNMTAVEEGSKAHERSVHLETAAAEQSIPKHGQASRSPTLVDKTQETTSANSDSDLFGTRHSSITTSTIQDSQAKNEELINSDKMQYTLFIMERALNMNFYFEKLLYYRDLEYYADLMEQMKVKTVKTLGPDDHLESSERSKSKASEDLAANILKPDFALSESHLELLWKFTIPFTKGKNIAALSWNRQNPDILAACYGEFDYMNQKPGLVCCWSLKNIDYPERTYHLPSGATAISWSKAHSNLLAVGMFNGTISVFDVRRKSNEPVINTKHSSGRHLGPVRQLEWAIRVSGRSEEHSEALISISSDGRVTQWSVRKGFESSDLMKLKRIATKIPGAGKQKKTDALISQYAAGSCFAFNPKDQNIYLAGVEEGHIHKCSCSYNEQYLENFFGHTAPVYSIKYSPFINEVFLSCSADWTIKLWHIERQNPVINFQSAVKSVNSIAWSPKCSTIFACVNEGAVEVWNLQLSTLDPLIVETICPEATVLTSVIFTEAGDCLIVGDSDGILYTYVMRNLPQSSDNQDDEVEALDKTIQSCIASQLQKK